MCKMTPKLLYLVFTVVITFEGTRGNVEPRSSAPIKHVREVLPTSLLFLLNRRPTSGLGYKKITPVSPIPLSPSAPVEPFAPLTPSIPAIPNAPVSPSIPYSPEAPNVPNTRILPKSFYPTIRYGQNDQQATQTSSSGQLSYDNPSNGNRKILNVVHINPRRQSVPIPRQPSQPTLPETLTTNPAETENKVTEKSKDLSPNSFQIKPKDIPYEPVKNIEASPIPVQPKNTEVVPSQATNVDSETKENKGLDKSTNSYQINPKDFTFEPVKNIEASPIPVQPKNTEVISSLATNIDSETKKNKDLDESKNSFQINPKDIPFEPVDNIAASPIPVQPKNTGVVPSQATNEDSETKENKDLDESKNSFQINPKDIPFEPVKNIEASPIPVQPKNTEVVPSQATNVNSASPIAETSEEGKNPDLIGSPGNNEANAIPVKPQITPEPSEEKAAVPDGKNTLDISTSEHNNTEKASKTEDPQNPLKDLILNGNPSSNNADNEESKTDYENKADTHNENSSSKNDQSEREESEKQEDNLNKDTTESDSTNYESPTDETHSGSTYDESRYTSLPEGSHSESTDHESEAISSDNTHSQSTDSQSENLSATKSNTESTDSQSENSSATNSNTESTDGQSENSSATNSNTESTDSQSENSSATNSNTESTDSQSKNSSATDSNTGSSNGATSEDTESSENTQNESSETKEGNPSAGIEEIQDHQGPVQEN